MNILQSADVAAFLSRMKVYNTARAVASHANVWKLIDRCRRSRDGLRVAENEYGRLGQPKSPVGAGTVLLWLTETDKRTFLSVTRVNGMEMDGAPGEIRTPDLLVRSQALYPTELRARRGRE
jgi:hypothetical protein